MFLYYCIKSGIFATHYLLLQLATLANYIVGCDAKFSVLYVICLLISRVIFFSRVIGLQVKVKNLIITEIVGYCSMLLCNVMSKSAFDWRGIVLSTLALGLSALIMYYDEQFMVYGDEVYMEEE